MLNHSEDGTVDFEEFFLSLSESMLHVYESKVDFINDKENPMLAIPLVAISGVIEQIDHEPLGLDFNNESIFELADQKFALKLKNSFLPAYLSQSYS